MQLCVSILILQHLNFVGVNSIVNVFQDAVVQVCGTVGGSESLHWRNGKLALFE